MDNPYIEWGDLYKLFDSENIFDDVFLNFEAKIEYSNPDFGIPYDISVRHKDGTWNKSYHPFYETMSSPNPFYDSKFKYRLVEELKMVIRNKNLNNLLNE